MISITTPAQTTALTTLAHVKDELAITVSTFDSLLTRYISEASDEILKFVDRVLAREQVTETLVGTGRTILMVGRRPLVALTSVSYDGDALDAADYQIGDKAAGFVLSLTGGFYDDRPNRQWINLEPVSQPGEPLYSVVYWAGFLLPGDVRSGTTYSAAAADNSINDSAGNLPLYVAGDVVTVSGFATAGNNGRAVVVSRTASKLIVSGLTLANEAAGQTVSLDGTTLPADFSVSCIEMVVARYRARGRDPHLKQESLGDWSATYADPKDSKGLPMSVMERLSKYKNVA